VKPYGNKPPDLAVHQRKLLGLIKSTYEGSDDKDPYIRLVASSTNLELIQEVVTWWRAFAIERYCTLTASLLKRLGVFDQAVQKFSRNRKTSRFIGRLATDFLDEMRCHEKDLVSSVAQFELALIQVKHGDDGEHLVNWRHNPNSVLHSLLHGTPLGETIDNGHYQTIVSNKEPELFRVLRL
jgi:hypothetical protein